MNLSSTLLTHNLNIHLGDNNKSMDTSRKIQEKESFIWWCKTEGWVKKKQSGNKTGGFASVSKKNLVQIFSRRLVISEWEYDFDTLLRWLLLLLLLLRELLLLLRRRLLLWHSDPWLCGRQNGSAHTVNGAGCQSCRRHQLTRLDRPSYHLYLLLSL